MGVRGQLRDDRSSGNFADGRHTTFNPVRIGAIIEPLFDIRAGEVKFQQVDSLLGFQPRNCGDIIINVPTHNVDDYSRPTGAQEREFFGDESFDTDIRQTDAIEHARRGFRNTRCWVPRTRFGRN